MAAANIANGLSSYYIKKYEERYGVKPVINRNKARWSWDNILADMTPTQIRRLLDYYFASNSSKAHDLDNFFYNYDKIIKSMEDSVTHREERQRLMKESEERAKEWRQRLDKRTKGN